MGAVYTTKNELITTVSEVVGYKSGLALTRERLLRLIPLPYQSYCSGADSVVRIRSEEYEDIVSGVLYGVGNTPVPTPVFPGIRIFHKYKDDAEKMELYHKVFGCFIKFLEQLPKYRGSEESAIAPRNMADGTSFVRDVKELYGLDGAAMALEFISDINLYLHQTPWADSRQIDWENTADLEDLFRSESLDTLYGEFFDQRFINYLQRNFGEIDEMNWRKFEGLTGEFFARCGFEVEMGPGRNDDGIDVRVWPNNKDKALPPALLVQCKCQKDKIEKVVVKGLYADILAEEAESGLIVTTSCLSPGAEATCKVRNYPIEQVNRKTLRKWIEAMRNPWAGVWLGE